MARLNDMLAKNGQLSQTLEEDNFTLEAEFINRLKDAEHVRWRVTPVVVETPHCCSPGHHEAAGERCGDQGGKSCFGARVDRVREADNAAGKEAGAGEGDAGCVRLPPSANHPPASHELTPLMQVQPGGRDRQHHQEHETRDS
jgi:hypothetical protein